MNRSHHLKNTAKRLRKDMTLEEWRMWDVLRGPQCKYKFRRQQQIGPYIVDFYCAELKLIIEADGGQHGGPNDQTRDAFLINEGFRILRFWNHDIMNNIDGVWMKITAKLNDLSQLPRITPTLTLPPQGGGDSSHPSRNQKNDSN